MCEFDGQSAHTDEGCLARFRSEWFTQRLHSVGSHDPRYDLIPSYEWQWVFMTCGPKPPSPPPSYHPSYPHITWIPGIAWHTQIIKYTGGVIPPFSLYFSPLIWVYIHHSLTWLTINNKRENRFVSPQVVVTLTCHLVTESTSERRTI